MNNFTTGLKNNHQKSEDRQIFLLLFHRVGKLLLYHLLPSWQKEHVPVVYFF